MILGIEMRAQTVAALGGFEGTPAQLAQLVLDQLVTYPESHDQADWVSFCGSTACVSGWAQLFTTGYLVGNYFETGRALLGLDKVQAYYLFHCLNNEQAQHALKYLANGQPMDWEAIGNRYTNIRAHPLGAADRLQAWIERQVLDPAGVFEAV